MTPIQAMYRGALTLGIFALITAGSIAVTRAITAERIDIYQQAYQFRQLQEVLPEAFSDLPLDEIAASVIVLPDAHRLGHRGTASGWRISQGQHTVLVLPAITQQGYSGEIRLLVGIDGQQNITGVRVTHHQETPGLGDDIERQRSDWITHFDGLNLHSLPPQAWAVRKEGGQFDAFTGATITPRAVIKAVYNTLEYAADTNLLANSNKGAL